MWLLACCCLQDPSIYYIHFEITEILAILLSDWLSAVQFFHQNYCTIFALNCVFFSANEKGSHSNAIKWKSKFVSGSFVPKSYLWFQINTACLFNFEITGMTSYQIALHLVQLHYTDLFEKQTKNWIHYLKCITINIRQCKCTFNVNPREGQCASAFVTLPETMSLSKSNLAGKK